MNHSLVRLAAISGAAMFAAISSAQSFHATIYGPPSGFGGMLVSGTANGSGSPRVLMSGTFEPTSGFPQAGYMTNSGSRLMTPSGWLTAAINDSWGGTYHTGSGRSSVQSGSHALFWLGGNAGVDLHPAGSEYVSSEALGGGGQLQVGWVQGTFDCAQCNLYEGTHRHAASWSRTSSSFQRVHAPHHATVVAWATNGSRIVGAGFERSTLELEALLWNSPGSNPVSLQPVGYMQSSARTIGDIGDGRVIQGGSIKGVATQDWPHAAIWFGSAASFRDLNPSPFRNSEIVGIRNGFCIANGRAWTTQNRDQAFALSANTGAWINLHALLPYPFNLWNSFATDINEFGDVVGYIERDGVKRPVIWLRQ